MSKDNCVLHAVYIDDSVFTSKVQMELHNKSGLLWNTTTLTSSDKYSYVDLTLNPDLELNPNVSSMVVFFKPSHRLWDIQLKFNYAVVIKDFARTQVNAKWASNPPPVGFASSHLSGIIVVLPHTSPCNIAYPMHVWACLPN